MKTEDLVKSVDLLIEKASQVLSTARTSGYRTVVEEELFNEFRASSLSFLNKLFGTSHTYYKEFDKNVAGTYPSRTESGRGILQAVKTEIENGWLYQIKDFISAEIFSDFLEMAEYLLVNKYKDPAAVMIGSVLEEHIRQLCDKNSIETFTTDSKGKQKPKKADLLNAELTKANVYNKLDQKNITAWLDLRNNAAHGKYSEYNKDQVDSMHRGVLEFLGRLSI
ncbi:hypothetical protein KC717_04785 [Candidatus Dojkabacteria bacterium]|uniref:DUF4145 domain-containing protein n=1 Tax=Candidatus Dojkabacteria bacterium TaxID=2099670 RepID=A0A955L8Y8_9BACT|nr:hypothetical protein [Candidatus Dojkabacteria bacterium]